MTHRYAPIAAALIEAGWRWPAWRQRVLYVSWHVVGPLLSDKLLTLKGKR